jgi:hypothetical protein
MPQVYHAMVDAALSIPYFYANGGTFALGQSGSSCTKTACPNVDNEDVIRHVGTTHGPNKWFQTIFPMIELVISSRWN